MKHPLFCLITVVLLGSVGIGYAHNGAYELTLEEWVRETPDIEDIGEERIIARCNKRENYNEVLLGKANIELNQHKDNAQNYLDPYSITLWGWINSFGIQTSDNSAFWHGKPAMFRWNNQHFRGPVVTKKLFMDIAREGKFKFYLEPNPIRCPGCISVEGVIKVDNPDVIRDCFK